MDNLSKMNTSLKWIYKNNNYYTWDVSIGKYGAFHYKNSNNEIITEEITLDNIGPITTCLETFEYSHINDCIGISETTVELSNIPIGSKFGWDDKAYCWVYYLTNSLKPSFFAKRISSV
jgi:hypothetical protein